MDSKDVCILPDSTDPAGNAASEAVVHLVIQRPAKVGWHHAHDNNFELSISRGDTAATVKRKLEDHHGLPADSHSLLYNGKILSCSKPLLQYGIDKGSVLELAPFEPSPTLTPSTSPMLSSPQHELFEGWQKARAGLAKGFAPRLAAAGTGGDCPVLAFSTLSLIIHVCLIALDLLSWSMCLLVLRARVDPVRLSFKCSGGHASGFSAVHVSVSHASAPPHANVRHCNQAFGLYCCVKSAF